MPWLRKGWYAIATVCCLMGTAIGADGQTEREDFISDGAQLLTQDQVAEMFTGNTFHGGLWTSYYDQSGRKATRIGDRVIEREWWIEENGTVCQTLNRTGETACGPQFYRLGEVYRSFRADGSLLVEFTMAPGNPEGL
ncbi:MAG: hypothetical protein H6842_12435 [Rhodospirillaceae bacterium]|nr:hypothetical protein [Rhodospirillaceae bacterium]